MVDTRMRLLGLLACAPATSSCYTPVDVPLLDDTFDGCGCIGQRCDLRHLGVDLEAPVGTPVSAVADGEVVFVAGPEQAAGWGDGNRALFVRHEAMDGPIVALYGHVRTSLVPGDVVRAGQAIAEIGEYHERLDDGLVVTWPSHLHFGVHPGSDVPEGPTGLAPDPDCEGEDTLGWVDPVAFLASGAAR